MELHPSLWVIRLAKAAPALAKPLLRLAVRAFPSSIPHWVVAEVSRELNCRFSIWARLGNGMKIQVWSDGVGREIRAHGYSELPTVKLIQSLLKAGMLFIDAGANVGEYTLLAAGLGATVHSFEPDPETFGLLRRNVAVNSLAHVSLNQSALGEHCGTTTFYLGRPFDVAVGSMRWSEKRPTPCQVECQALDVYAKENCVTRADLIKVDVEGAELQVLAGAHSLLSGRSKPYIVVEFSEPNQRQFGYSTSELAEYLRSLGYDLFRIVDSGVTAYEPTENEPAAFNVLAVPS